MTTIYVVENGEYSDRRTCGVFSSRGLAQQAIDAGLCGVPQRENISVAEWTLDELDTQGGRLTPFEVRMDRDGNNATAEPLKMLPDDEDDYDVYYDLLDFEIMWLCPPTECHTHVLARNEKHAIKIANERRTKWIALNGEPK